MRVIIEKLNNDNYYTWKYKLELLLIKEECWEVIVGEIPNPKTPVWQKRDDKARATIGLLVEDNQLIHIREAKNAKDAWNALKGYHEKSTLSTRVILLKSIVNQRLDESGDMEEHVSRIINKMNKYAALGEPLTNTLQIAIILGSLPSSYDTLVTALESRSEDELTLALVKEKLIDEYKRRKNSNDETQDESALKSFNNARNCYFCKKPGHLRSECTRYKQWKRNKERQHAGKVESNDSDDEREEYHCFLAHDKKPIEAPVWCIDSGATSHMSSVEDFSRISQS